MAALSSAATQRPLARTQTLSLLAAWVLTAVALVALSPPHMEHWDEIQLELGMRRYDLAWHQPHPPGYVLFVLAGRFVGWLTKVAHPGRVLSIAAALGWISWVTARVPGDLDPRARNVVPLVLPFFVLLSPTLLTHATTGRTYMVESVLWVSILMVVTRHTRWTPLVLGALVGFGGGFRPTILGWGAAAIACWCWSHRRSISRRDLGELGAALIGATSIWLGALAVLTGGLARYSELSAPIVRDNIFAKSLFVKGPEHVLGERLPLMLQSLWIALGPVLFVTAALIAARATAKQGPRLRALDPLLHGSAVSFCFYLLLIFDSDGYALSFVLPLLTWTVLAGATLVAQHDRELVAGAAIAALVVLWGWLPGGLLTRNGIPSVRARNEARFAARRVALATLPEANTLLVTGAEYQGGWSFRLLMYETPGRAVLQLAHDPYFPLLGPDVPYLAAVHRQPMGIGPDGVDLSRLPSFTAEHPLRYVVFANPKEAAERVDGSCAKHVTRLRVSDKESFPVLEVGAKLRAFAQNGLLTCSGA